MSKTFLAVFRAGSDRYEHSVDGEDTFVASVKKDDTLFTVNEGGWVRNRFGNLSGRFRRLPNQCWYYTALDDSLRLNTKFTDRWEAERDVFSVLLGFGHSE